MDSEIRHLSEYNKSMMDKRIEELNEYNKSMMNSQNLQMNSQNPQAYELDLIKRTTNIKCEKCDGLYRHQNYYMTYTSNPPKKLVVCVLCGDEQYIIV